MLKGTFSFREVRRERILDNRNKALKVQEKQAAMMEKVFAMMMVIVILMIKKDNLNDGDGFQKQSDIFDPRQGRLRRRRKQIDLQSLCLKFSPCLSSNFAYMNLNIFYICAILTTLLPVLFLI